MFSVCFVRLSPLLTIMLVVVGSRCLVFVLSGRQVVPASFAFVSPRVCFGLACWDRVALAGEARLLLSLSSLFWISVLLLVVLLVSALSASCVVECRVPCRARVNPSHHHSPPLATLHLPILAVLFLSCFLFLFLFFPSLDFRAWGCSAPCPPALSLLTAPSSVVVTLRKACAVHHSSCCRSEDRRLLR